MLKQSRILLAAFALSLMSSTAMHAQAATQTPVQKFLSHIDVGLNGTGVFTKSTTGPVTSSSATNPGAIVTQEASNTFGALFTLRATKSPYVGLEGNIGYQRFTESYSCCNLQGGAQTNAYEYTFGYVVHPPHEILGAKPFASVGAGTTAFRPTVNGGQGLSTQARATYYYSAGVDVPAFTDFFSVRLGFRQLFYLAPDFGQKYITTKQRTITSEPVIGFVFHF
jgi:hypothetical protein